MDTKLLTTTLYEGSSIPGTGQTWPNMAPITGGPATRLVAAFNSGFRMQDAQGGYYADGVTAIPLVRRPGLPGHHQRRDPAIGALWGPTSTMSPSVVAVRQNLDLIVDTASRCPGLNANDNHPVGRHPGWEGPGVALGARASRPTAPWSTSAAPGSRIVDLANVLSRAGAVRAMEMDINTAWVNFFSYSAPPGQPASAAVGTKLTFDESNWPGRYFSPSSRDFITMSATQHGRHPHRDARHGQLRHPLTAAAGPDGSAGHPAPDRPGQVAHDGEDPPQERRGRRPRWRPDSMPAHDRVGHRLGGGRERGRGHALGHPADHEAGADDHHPDAGADQRVAQALGEGVEPGLGGPVDEVGLAGPLAGHRREHDQAAVALAAQAAGHGQHGRRPGR